MKKRLGIACVLLLSCISLYAQQEYVKKLAGKWEFNYDKTAEYIEECSRCDPDDMGDALGAQIVLQFNEDMTGNGVFRMPAADGGFMEDSLSGKWNLDVEDAVEDDLEEIAKYPDHCFTLYNDDAYLVIYLYADEETEGIEFYVLSISENKIVITEDGCGVVFSRVEE